ncbi:MAG: IS1 family transposase [Stellaceae bacterium]
MRRGTVAWVPGGRDDATCQNLLDKVGITGKTFLTDDWDGFHRLIPKDQLFTGKDLTFSIEQDNSDIRHFVARFRRRTKVVSKSALMVDRSLRLYHYLHDNPQNLAALLASFIYLQLTLSITGRLYNEWWARIAAILVFFGFNLTFFPQFILGWLGMPRRYFSCPPEFAFWNILSSAGAAVLALAYALPLFYLGYSLLRGERAGPNPWGATGLEWQTPSPPPTHNFETPPIVTRGPYQYTPEPIPQNA